MPENVLLKENHLKSFTEEDFFFRKFVKSKLLSNWDHEWQVAAESEFLILS